MMRTIFSFCLFASVASPAFAEQRVANLWATDGTEITVDYNIEDTLVPGVRSSVQATWAQVSVNFAQFPDYNEEKLLVFMNFCTSRNGNFSAVYSCSLSQGTGGAPFSALVTPVGSGSCRVETVAPQLERRHPDLLLSSLDRSGFAQTCTQELAIKVGDRWLVDPVNQFAPEPFRHNFKFDMNY